MIIFSWKDSIYNRFIWMTSRRITQKLFFKSFFMYGFALTLVLFILWGAFADKGKTLPSPAMVLVYAFVGSTILSALNVASFFIGRRFYIYDKYLVIGARHFPIEDISVEFEENSHGSPFSFFINIAGIGKMKTQVESFTEYQNLISSLEKVKVKSTHPWGRQN